MELTLAIIKPGAYNNNLTAPILKSIYDAGFEILAIKSFRMNKAQAKAFYTIHREKPFFEKLVHFMISGPVVAIVLRKENAITDLRQLLGDTDPEKAKESTIRRKYGSNKTENAIHGADSRENAIREIGFFFSESELLG